MKEDTHDGVVNRMYMSYSIKNRDYLPTVQDRVKKSFSAARQSIKHDMEWLQNNGRKE